MEQRNQQAHKQQHSSRQSSTPFWAIGLVICCTVVIAYAQFLFKRSLEDTKTWGALALSPTPYFGMLLFFACGLLVTYALKHGELSALHPLVGLGVFWVALASVLLLGEKLSLQHAAGIVVIILGIVFISHSTRRVR